VKGKDVKLLLLRGVRHLHDCKTSHRGDVLPLSREIFPRLVTHPGGVAGTDDLCPIGNGVNEFPCFGDYELPSLQNGVNTQQSTRLHRVELIHDDPRPGRVFQPCDDRTVHPDHLPVPDDEAPEQVGHLHPFVAGHDVGGLVKPRRHLLGQRRFAGGRGAGNEERVVTAGPL